MCKIKRVICTGSEGYIGAVLVPILQHKYEVIGLDTNYFKDCRIGDHPNNYQLIEKDIRDVTKNDLDGIDAVIHLAGLSNDPMGDIDEQLTYDINFKASWDLAVAAKKAGVKRFIFSSSCSIYGSNPRLVTETFPLDPLTEYAQSKMEVESILMYTADGEFCPISLRNATVYGYSPMFRTDLVVNNLVASAFQNKKIILKSDGSAMRPFIYIYDLARVFEYMLEADFNSVYNQVFNVGTNFSNYKIIDIAQMVSDVTGCPIEFAEGAQPDKRNYAADFTKFRKYFPDFRFSGDLQSTIFSLNDLYVRHLITPDMSKYTRLDCLLTLMHNNRVDSNLYWVS